MGIFVNQEKIHPYSIFSPFWGENFLVGPERKHLNPTIYFPSSPPNETHFKKVFFPIFSPKFFIHPISPPNKHNHNDESLWAIIKYLYLVKNVDLTFHEKSSLPNLTNYDREMLDQSKWGICNIFTLWLPSFPSLSLHQTTHTGWIWCI